MPSKPEHLYEYAIIRFLPCVEREEFINIGLIMMCKRKKWIKVQVNINTQRLEAFHSPIGIEALQRQLDSLIAVAEGDRRCGDMWQWPVEERFRWLTAVHSACLQTSRPHPGLTDNLEATFKAVFAQMVL